jgi:glycine/D-amino acid oxidase-like deaminating enzyme
MSTVRFPARSLTPRDAVRGLWLDDVLGARPAPRRWPALDSNLSTDVCIIGGGFTGLWTALEIKRRAPQTDVVLIDADICGGGASGRNGGFAMTWWSKFVSLEKLCGTETSAALCRRAEDAVRSIGRFCDEHSIDADFRPCGWLWAATNTAQMDAWDGTIGALANAGLEPYERLTRQQVAERTGSPVHLGGIFDPDTAIVQPAALAQGLARVADEAGVRIYEGTAMTELVRDEPAIVRTPGGDVRASTVVLAMNAWVARLPELARALVVVSSDVIATEPIPDELDAIGWRRGPAISDSRRLINYYRTSADGRVVFGKGGGAVAVTGRMGSSFHRASTRADEVTAQFRFVYPMLWQIAIDRAWRGPIDYSVTGAPFFARLPSAPNILLAAGFSGNGVGPARLAGELMAEMAIDGGDAGLPPALTRLPSAGLPPEPVRYVGARLVRAAVARKESAEDVGRRAGALTLGLAKLDPTSFVDRGSAPAAR